MKSNSLFELIRSLTKHEKGYFRKFSRLYSTEGDKNYLELFDFIGKMQSYDEKAVKAEFKRTNWIKHLPALKKYLFSQILKSLELYQRAGKKDAKAVFRQVDILIDRGLYKEALDMLKEGQAIAAAQENYAALLSSYDRERFLAGYLFPTSQLSPALERIGKLQNEALKMIGGIIEIQQISDTIRDAYNKHGVIRDQTVMSAIDIFAEKRLIPGIYKYQSFAYRQLALGSAAIYFTMKSEHNEVLKYIKEYLKMVLENPRHYSDRPLLVMSIYYNYLICCIDGALFKEFDKHIRDFENLSTNNGLTGKAFKFHLLFQLYFKYIMARKAYPLIFHHLRKFEKEFKLYRSMLDPRDQTELLFDLALLLFLSGKGSDALDWINICMSINGDDISNFMKAKVRVMDIILHYELRNFRLLESKVLSTKRYLGKNRIFYKSENAIMKYFRQFIKTSSQVREKEIFRKFHMEMKDIYDANPAERTLIDELHLFPWMEARMRLN